MSHPYRDLPPQHFWSRVVAAPAVHEIDPVVNGRVQVSAAEPIATLGSCFAQHLARFLQRSGLSYFVTEDGPATMEPDERLRRNYGVFSARYGNVYTTRQAVQLFDRAYGPLEPALGQAPWPSGDRWVDPFRPAIEPDGFASAEALAADREAHLQAVRRMFEEASVVVFTLGLTEGWRARSDGAVFPVVPGAAGGTFDPSEHEFVNFGLSEVLDDLLGFVDRVHDVNGSVRFLLTVSPVPLIATYTDKHVLTATTYSKSVLRVAAAEAERQRDFVEYFPAYEIITGPAAGGRYFAPDLRSITDVGVAHVMRVFARHHVMGRDGDDGVFESALIASEISRVGDLVCDEEMLEPGVTG